MKKGSLILGVVLLIGLTAYVYLYNRQMADVEEVCGKNAVGNVKPDFEKVKNTYGDLTISSSIEVNDEKDQKVVYVCAPLTMCDTSCSITFTENKIIKSVYREY